MDESEHGESAIVDISDWQKEKHFNTKGTREKWIVVNNNGALYFFKKSKLDYKYEFWSEITAYHIGTMLGFPVLRYEVAIQN